MRGSLWSIGFLATLSLAAALACGDGTGPIAVTSIDVDPQQLQLHVGDSAGVNVVLLADGHPVGVNASKNGALMDCYTGWDYYCSPGGAGLASKVVGYAYQGTVTTIWVEGVAPGRDTLWLHFMDWTPCSDPPMCYTSQLRDVFPPEKIPITVD